MEMTVGKEEVYTYWSLETGGREAMQGHKGKAPGSVRRQKRKRENMVQSLYWGFQGIEWTKQGKYAV